MRRSILALAAFATVLPGMVTQVEARDRRVSNNTSSSQEVRRCRHSSGTTGLIAGGAVGAVVGHEVIGGGALGTIAGAVGGAFAGRAIDRTITAKKRCR